MAGVPLLLMAALSLDPPRRFTAADVANARSLRHFMSQRRVAIGLFVGVAGCLLVAQQALNQLTQRPVLVSKTATERKAETEVN